MPVSFIQTEKLYTINFFVAPGLAGFNAVMFLSLLLLLGWLIICFYYRRRDRQAWQTAAWWLLFLLWLPIALSSWLTHYRLATQGLSKWSAPPAAKWQNRLCRVDDEQQFAGLLCNLEPTIRTVKERVGARASVCQMVNDTARPFFTFGLYADFDLPADCATADYVLAYRATDHVVYSAEGHLLRLAKTGNGQEVSIDYGRFAPPQVLGDGIFLLKRQP